MKRISRRPPDTLPSAPWWADEAACRTADPDLFFPKDHRRAVVPLITMQAKAYCHACPVIDDCLRFALQRPESHGVWGGLDEDERQLIRRREQRRARRRAARASKSSTAAN